MRFWESSALVPLFIHESTTADLVALMWDEREVHVWWGAEVECVSAFARYERKSGAVGVVSMALDRLRKASARWIEVAPGDAVRQLAKRLLRVHPLSAGDAFQLAAVQILSEEHRNSVDFVCLDQRLREAASREGFTVLPVR